MSDSRRAVVTGASSGIGEATARALAADGFDVTVGARREERIRRLADELKGEGRVLDVTDPESVEAFCEAAGPCDVLVCSAGGAVGLETIEESSDADWQTMFDTNVMGTVRLVRRLLPTLRASGRGHVVLIGSVAGRQAYPRGGGYNAAKFAVSAVRDVLRHELLGEPVAVTQIDPGMVRTEFSEVRFRGDADRAAAVYAGMKPLHAADIAECVRWAVTRPSHVNIDSMLVLARDQSDATTVHRRV